MVGRIAEAALAWLRKQPGISNVRLNEACASLVVEYPDLLRQEFYGFIMANFAIRGLMHEAALQANKDPDELSFFHTVRCPSQASAQFSLGSGVYS